jgi:hypothetical protein
VIAEAATVETLVPVPVIVLRAADAEQRPTNSNMKCMLEKLSFRLLNFKIRFSETILLLWGIEL